jgi:hypothetical protein
VNIRNFDTSVSAGIVLILGSPVSAQVLSTSKMAGDPGMTPGRFAKALAGFSYQFRVRAQAPDEFLSRRVGDCDDFAIAACTVLRMRGYHTHLVLVRMEGRVAHAVCYVEESCAYLDYNNRAYFLNLTSSKWRLREIADKVAKSLDARWTSVSELTYDTASEDVGIKWTVVKTAPPSEDPDDPKRMHPDPSGEKVAAKVSGGP